MLKHDGVIWHTAISLDGYAADVNDSLAFMARYEAPNPLIDEVEANIGCTLGGRRGYDVFRARDEEPQAYGDAVQVPEYVVTRRPFPDDPKTLFADGNDLPAVVAKAKATANGRMVVILGPTLGSALLRAGLVDQIVLHVTPVLIGAGIKIFADTGEPPVHLELIHLSQSGQTTNLVFEPRPN
ncbi:hypothetical protein VE25_12420 [Devosia geojensis]|uniref:Bacterial bifunctional deaminase-reductase C-terminal domain-containing protein n=1 Tax=Devosia geojensis TaxID=443610 RepID=A0A0F5FRN5_9HYPH|nr:dihydrofolate reductase family protein [Devosia geojensis]KKB11503.1 hypothetical protein VE25_12420 [Devosia geojensis]